MAAYQHYQRLPDQPGPAGVLDEQLASLLRPLVVLAAVLADAVLDTTPAPATVVLTSTSSRTARAVARELTNRAHRWRPLRRTRQRSALRRRRAGTPGGRGATSATPAQAYSAADRHGAPFTGA